jgi:ubiquinone biosynthesis protein COQ9
MIDLTTPKGKLIEAALRLAATKPWRDVTLLDIAEAATMPLAEVRKIAGSKGQIVAKIMRAFDDELLGKMSTRTPGQNARDNLFEVIMARFDVMTPYKAAMKSIAAAGPSDPSLLGPFLNSQRWMLAAAGIGADGPQGLVRSAGLGSVYMSAFQAWLDDDDPGLARTMARLDTRLRSGERTLSAVEGIAGGFVRLATDLPKVMCAAFTRPAPRPREEPVTPPNPV